VDAIVAEALEKRYQDVRALDGVSFRVRAGEVFGLLGPNGAGKSTTVKVLTTLTTPDSGRAEVAGHDVVRDPNAVRRSIGYVPQSSGVDRDATGRENLMLQGRVQGCPDGGCAPASSTYSTCSGSPRRPTGSSAATRAG
jgi:ABC-2 type transport system ATP-binding protein